MVPDGLHMVPHVYYMVQDGPHNPHMVPDGLHKVPIWSPHGPHNMVSNDLLMVLDGST